MKPRIIFYSGVLLTAVASLLLISFFKPPARENKPVVETTTNAVVAMTTNVPEYSRTNAPKPPGIKTRFSDFTSEEQSAFTADFEKRYKPALQKWCDAFSGRVPLSPAAVTSANFAERIGRNAAYHEYVFVVDGITLGIEDRNGIARLDYLNNPHQTQKLTANPDGSQAPLTTSPVTREELQKMLAVEGGRQYSASDVRITSSGFSGRLNGGVFVRVGGDPENAASWDYDMIFGPDGKLAYYLKGN